MAMVTEENGRITDADIKLSRGVFLDCWLSIEFDGTGQGFGGYVLGGNPFRVQLSRRKGWRMPPNTVKVSRPGVFGNPFTVAAALESGYASSRSGAQEFVVACFRDWLTRPHRKWWQGPESDARRRAVLARLPDLRGKNLACWCKPGAPCHADVLIELANAELRKPIGATP